MLLLLWLLHLVGLRHTRRHTGMHRAWRTGHPYLMLRLLLSLYMRIIENTLSPQNLCRRHLAIPELAIRKLVLLQLLAEVELALICPLEDSSM